MTALRLGALYFAAVFAAGFCLGALRTVLLEPRLGAPAAVLAELPLMLAISWAVAGRLVAGRGLSAGGAAAMGAVAFALLMAAEAGLSAVLAGRGPLDHLALYREPARLAGLAGQVAFALFPMLRR